MKKFFSILFLCCAPFVYADDDSFIVETDEKIAYDLYVPFAAEEPIFEETQADCCGEPEPQEINGLMPNLSLIKSRVSYVSWSRYKANFGMEKLFLRFPQKPAVSHGATMLTAYAYDGSILYSLTGYYPPLGHIEPTGWFDTLLCSLDNYPFKLISHVIFQHVNGNWVMDYVAHDYAQNLILKNRAILTPFNGYTLQCVKPNGMRDYFDYFLDHFLLKCEAYSS
jgi:hypothetical protein